MAIQQCDFHNRLACEKLDLCRNTPHTCWNVLGRSTTYCSSNRKRQLASRISYTASDEQHKHINPNWQSGLPSNPLGCLYRPEYASISMDERDFADHLSKLPKDCEWCFPSPRLEFIINKMKAFIVQRLNPLPFVGSRGFTHFEEQKTMSWNGTVHSCV